MADFNITPLTSISRKPNRGFYDKETIYAILDEAIDITISYVAQGMPMAIPNGFVRMGDEVYIHGSIKSHFIQQLYQCEKVCLSVSLLDGMVLANTAFNHSFNYRSVVAFSKPYEVTDQDRKWDILKAFTDKLLPGRWEDDIKKPTPDELKITAVVGFSLSEASAKIRAGAAGNSNQDMHRKVWTGYVPLKRYWAAPVKNEDTDPLVEEPEYLRNLYGDQKKEIF